MIHPKYIFTFLLPFFFNLSLAGQSFNMNGTPVTSCTGYFNDSGGVGLNYGLDENFTTTICSDATNGTHIRLLFSGIDIGEGDSIRIYDAPTADAAFQFDNAFLLNPNNQFVIQATAANPSGCLTIVFTSDNIDSANSGWSASISCIASCQTIEAILSASSPTAAPIGTGWIDICPGDEVSFDGLGIFPQNNISYIQANALSTFEWDFGDGTTAIGAAASHLYSEPGGYTVQLTITDQLGCVSTNFINQRVRVSTVPDFEVDAAIDFTVCVNDVIMLTSGVDTLVESDVLAQVVEGSFRPVFSSTDSIILPDGVGASYESSLFFNQFAVGAVLENAEDLLGVLLNIEHSYYGDLGIELICPDGTSIDLLTRDNAAPLGSANLGEPWATSPTDTRSYDSTKGIGYDYTFVNNSPNGTLRDVVNGLPSTILTTLPSEESGEIFVYPDRTFPAGEYQSDMPFLNLIGCPLNGQWTIRITDYLANDNGWLYNWALLFPDDLFTNIERFTPVLTNWNWETNPTVVSNTPEMLSAIPTNPGIAQYTFWVEDDFGCRYDTTLVYDVLPPTHPACLQCDMQVNEQPDLLLCQGEMAQLDVSPLGNLAGCITFEQFPQQPIGAANYPVGSPYASTFDVNSINPAVITNPLTDICAVCIDLSTDNLSDITLILQAPDGSQVLLSEMNGGNSAAGYVQTCFSPSALMTLPQAVPPYTGSFQPQDAGGWGAFVNSPINGQWTLWVSDCCDLTQTGELLEWSISFNNVTEYTYAWAANPDLSCLDCDSPTLTASSSGNQLLTISNNFGCVLEQSIGIQLVEELAAPDVSCTAQNNGILFEWTALPVVLQFDYRLTINGVVQPWSGAFLNNMLFVDNLAHGDILSIEVRPFLANAPANCLPAIGMSSCTVDICDLVIGNASTTDASCFETSDGSISIQVLSGTLPYTYQISGDNTIYDTPTISGLAPGFYTYTVINGDGCSLMEDFTIGSPDSLYVDGNQTFAACFGEPQNEATALAGGGSGTGYSISWSTGQAGAEQAMLSAGDYQISVTDSNGCEASNTITIDNLAPITFNFLTNAPSCFGFNDGGVGINQISGGSGLSDMDYQYIWEDGSNEIVRTNLLGGETYCITVTDMQGCTADLCRILEQPEMIPVVLEGTTPSCKGDQDGQISIISPSPLDSYEIQWSDNAAGQMGETIINLSSNTYGVTLTNSLGCEGESSLFLNDPLALTASSVIEHNACFNTAAGSIQSIPSGGVAPYSYQWSNTASDTSFTDNLLAGTYTVTITDNNGCRLEDAFVITQAEEVSVTIEETPATCFGNNDGSIMLTMSGGSPPFQYSLNGGLFSNSSFIPGLGAGDYNIQIRDAGDCRLFVLAQIEEPEEFIIDLGTDIRINFGDSIQLSTNNQAGDDLLYFWQEPYPGTLSCLNCPEPFAAPEYTIDYKLLVIDAEGCRAEDQLRVFVDKNYIVEVPTGFTPNNDGSNDLLRVHGTPGIEVLNFQVFDRWGEEVFFAQDFEVNSSIVGWDGNFRNQAYNSGVFVWQLQVRYPDGRIEGLYGQTTLIR